MSRQNANFAYITKHPEHSDRAKFGEYWPHLKSGLPSDFGKIAN
jgi:hypothetical protein